MRDYQNARRGRIKILSEEKRRLKGKRCLQVEMTEILRSLPDLAVVRVIFQSKKFKCHCNSSGWEILKRERCCPFSRY